MSLSQDEITEIQNQIDNIKEYINSEICKMCEEMTTKLVLCEKLLNEYSRPNMDNTKSDS
jgi:flagellar biosynthesis/type III secretory pathway protein FliH